MNDITLSQFLVFVFLPYVVYLGAGVIGFILAVMFLLMFRGFMPKDR